MGQLAEEVVLFDGGERGVRVRRSDHAVLVRVHAKLCLELQAVLEGRARILELQHFGRFRHAQIEVSLVPSLEVGELVIRRQKRMRLPIALHLGDFHERLQACAGARILRGDRLSSDRD